LCLVAYVLGKTNYADVRAKVVQESGARALLWEGAFLTT
jgi:hypothetical protein